MCPFGVTPFLCFDVVLCPTETLDDDAHKIMTKVEQRNVLEYRVIKDTMNRRSVRPSWGLLLPHQDDAIEGASDQGDAMETACALLLSHQNDAMEEDKGFIVRVSLRPMRRGAVRHWLQNNHGELLTYIGLPCGRLHVNCLITEPLILCFMSIAS
ncbi:hypothetical protein TRIUR3_33459 [Triticum urartu]|uniref:Uncharacterized protein n=1 Tax=Triticum urartu TaxID=4572 RepID=M7XDJ6_TRIUA|nr:hypothetical protein TRIUR3_33459 [Triticum urartu]